MKKNKPGRNDPCWCGSGVKYKNCCLRKDDAEEISAMHDRLAEEMNPPGPSHMAATALGLRGADLWLKIKNKTSDLAQWLGRGGRKV